jgi:hypothetical protein
MSGDVIIARGHCARALAEGGLSVALVEHEPVGRVELVGRLVGFRGLVESKGSAEPFQP